jgi:8-oxo-dGTP diphosphatase
VRLHCPHCGGPLRSLRIPRLTVDAIIGREDGRVLLVERRYEPLGWALPGGFVDHGESVEEACRREVAEETGLAVHDLRQLHAYSDPSRDPRQHTVSIVFVARTEGEPRAGDDAASVRWVALAELPGPLCFDHEQILDDYRSGRWGIAPPL